MRLVAGMAVAGLVLAGCAAKPVIYGPIGPEAPHGYEDRQNADGGFTVRVAMPGGAQPGELRSFFDRRAAELCPAGVERTNVFNVQRNDQMGMNYASQGIMVGSRMAMSTELQGYVYCKPDPDAPETAEKAETAPDGEAEGS